MNGLSHETIWLLDLGNSRVKGAVCQADQLSQPFAVDWDAADFDDALRAQLSMWPAPARVLGAAVAPTARVMRARTALRASTRIDPQWLRSPRRACGVTNAYRIVESLGVDRFLAMVAARAAAQGSAAIVVGCGTALTLDALDAQGVQRDGLIAPSPALMLESLQASTAIAESHAHAFEGTTTDDTAHALRAGCEHAAAALTGWYATQQRAELGDATLWLHGGWAPSLRAILEQDGYASQPLHDAVLRGLAIWAQQSRHAQP